MQTPEGSVGISQQSDLGEHVWRPWHRKKPGTFEELEALYWWRERERKRERKWCEVRLQTEIGNNQITQGSRMSWEGFGFILAKSLFVTYDKDLMQISLSWKGSFLVHIFGKSGIKTSGMAGSRNSNSIIKTFFSMSSLSLLVSAFLASWPSFLLQWHILSIW